MQAHKALDAIRVRKIFVFFTNLEVRNVPHCGIPGFSLIHRDNLGLFCPLPSLMRKNGKINGIKSHILNKFYTSSNPVAPSEMARISLLASSSRERYTGKSSTPAHVWLAGSLVGSSPDF